MRQTAWLSAFELQQSATVSFCCRLRQPFPSSSYLPLKLLHAFWRIVVLIPLASVLVDEYKERQMRCHLIAAMLFRVFLPIYIPICNPLLYVPVKTYTLLSNRS